MTDMMDRPYTPPDPSTATFREVLDYVDRALVRKDGEAAKLWAVLSALRGPDWGKPGQKRETTCHIRRAALPRTAESGKFYCVSDEIKSVATFDTHGSKFRWDAPVEHFTSHIWNAAAVLGLV